MTHLSRGARAPSIKRAQCLSPSIRTFRRFLAAEGARGVYELPRNLLPDARARADAIPERSCFYLLRARFPIFLDGRTGGVCKSSLYKVRQYV